MESLAAHRPPLFTRLLGPLPHRHGPVQDGLVQDGPVRDGVAQGLAAVILMAFAVYALVFYRASVSSSFDFMGFWMFARMLLEHPAAELYDTSRLFAFQAALGFGPDSQWPFGYSPVFMLLLWPLGLMPPDWALRAWVGTTLAAFIWAAAGNRARPVALLLLLLSPATTLGVVTAQTGFLTGALLLGGLRLIGPRPWIGGLLIALLTYKPQFGLLIPVALAAAGAWRGIAATCVWLAALLALTCLLFGPGIWLDWLAALPGFSAAGAEVEQFLWMQPTVAANLRLAGVPHGLAVALHGILAAMMAAAVWRGWRGGISAPAIGLLIAATLVATPYAFFYDLPMLTAAVLYLGAAGLRAGTLGVADAALLLGVLLVPSYMVAVRHGGSLLVLLAFAAWAAWRMAPGYAAANCNSASRAYSPP